MASHSARKKIDLLLERTQGRCHYCKRRIVNHTKYHNVKMLTDGWFTFPFKQEVIRAMYATVDHVIPRSKGGTNALKNLVASCFPCNNNKDNKKRKQSGCSDQQGYAGEE